jgi:hypothetical protein
MIFSLLALSLLHGSAQEQAEKSLPVRPVVLIEGFHRLERESFQVIDSEQQAIDLLGKALSLEDYLRKPTVDYSSYSAIVICHPRKMSLTSLKLQSVEASEKSLKISYSESYLDQVFIGLNDKVAEAPFLFIVVPKSNRTVYFYQKEMGPAKQGLGILKTTIPARKGPTRPQ